MIINNESGFVIEFSNQKNSYLDMNFNCDWSFGARLDDAYVFLTEASARDFINTEDIDVRSITIRKIQKVTCIQLD